MEPTVSPEDQLPWHGKEGLALYNKCAAYIARELNASAAQLWGAYTAAEWHELLLYAYRELVSLGLVSPPSTEHV